MDYLHSLRLERGRVMQMAWKRHRRDFHTLPECLAVTWNTGSG